MDNKDKKDMNIASGNISNINSFQNKPFDGNLPQAQGASYKISNPSSFVYVSKKIDKLAAGLYILSNLFPDKEPLKWKLRDTMLEILKDINKARSVNSASAILRGLHSEIHNVLEMLWVAQIGGLVSQMNFSIFKKEFEEIQSIIKEKSSNEGPVEDVFFEDSFFASDKNSESSNNNINVLEKNIPEAPAYGHTKNQTPYETNPKRVSHKGQKRPSVRLTSNPAQSNENYSEKDKINGAKYEIEHAGVISSKNKRRSMILKLLSKKGDLTIKDISLKFSDCSEKTIQRELNALIKDNVISRKGERRWSRYSIV